MIFVEIPSPMMNAPAYKGNALPVFMKRAYMNKTEAVNKGRKQCSCPIRPYFTANGNTAMNKAATSPTLFEKYSLPNKYVMNTANRLKTTDASFTT